MPRVFAKAISCKWGRSKMPRGKGKGHGKGKIQDVGKVGRHKFTKLKCSASVCTHAMSFPLCIILFWTKQTERAGMPIGCCTLGEGI